MDYFLDPTYSIPFNASKISTRTNIGNASNALEWSINHEGSVFVIPNDDITPIAWFSEIEAERLGIMATVLITGTFEIPALAILRNCACIFNGHTFFKILKQWPDRSDTDSPNITVRTPNTKSVSTHDVAMADIANFAFNSCKAKNAYNRYIQWKWFIQNMPVLMAPILDRPKKVTKVTTKAVPRKKSTKTSTNAYTEKGL